MPRHNFNDLQAFVTVAREGSFTRAAAHLGVTQSAVSQVVSGLEARLKMRLLTRSTRSVSLTAAGERLMEAIGHRFDEIEAELDALTELRDKPARPVKPSTATVVNPKNRAKLCSSVLPKPKPGSTSRREAAIPAACAACALAAR